MRRKFRLFLLLILILALSGCWDLTDVDRRIFVIAMGIDVSPDQKIDLIAQIPQPQRMLPPGSAAGRSTGKSFSVIESMGVSTNQAFDNLQTLTLGEVVVEQNRIIVISDKVASQKINPFIDFLIRSPKAPTQALIFMANGNTVNEILSMEPDQQILPGLAIFESSQSIVKDNQTYYMPIWKFQQKLVHLSKDPYLPLIGIDPKQKTYVISGLALFNKDHLAGKLNPEETQMFGILTNQMRSGALSIELPQGIISLRNIHGNRKIKVRLQNGDPFFSIKIHLFGTLNEVFGEKIKMTPGEIKKDRECH